MGVLACLTTGFDVIARRPGLIALPFLLDLFLWLGPRLSVGPLVEPLQRWLIERGAVPGLVESQTLAVAFEPLGEALATRCNIFGTLTPAPLIGVPALMAYRMPALTPLGERIVWELRALPLSAGMLVVCLILGLSLSALYLRQLGIGIIDETSSPVPGPPRWTALWGQMLWTGLLLALLFAALAFVAVLVVGFIGMSLLTLLVFVAGVDVEPALSVVVLLSSFLLITASSHLVFVALYLLFVVPGVVMLRRNPLEAMRESYLLTRGHPLEVFVLSSLLLVVALGFNVVWLLPEPDSWATIVGLAGHAFISTGLMATIFVFYQERLGFLSLFNESLPIQDVVAQPVTGE